MDVPWKNICKPRPSICEKIKPSLVSMIMQNEIACLKLYTALIFYCLNKFFLLFKYGDFFINAKTILVVTFLAIFSFRFSL